MLVNLPLNGAWKSRVSLKAPPKKKDLIILFFGGGLRYRGVGWLAIMSVKHVPCLGRRVVAIENSNRVSRAWFWFAIRIQTSILILPWDRTNVTSEKLEIFQVLWISNVIKIYSNIHELFPICDTWISSTIWSTVTWSCRSKTASFYPNPLQITPRKIDPVNWAN